MPDRFDIIVVGAGPGGSVAATVAAQHGLRTLLVDREEMPRDKACGDAIPEPSFLLMRELGITGNFRDSAFEIDYVRVVGPAGRQLTLAVFPRSGEKTRIMSRYTFDYLLFQHALKSGAEFKVLNVIEPLFEEDRVVGIRVRAGNTTSEYLSKLVIAADGATSAIARGLNPSRRPDNHMSISLRGYVETREELDAVIELAFLRTLIPGYGWIFPLSKHYANIGVGLRLDIYKRRHHSLSEYLQAYLDTPRTRKLVGDNKIRNMMSWQLPTCSMEQKRVFNGAILIGDAGGFVNPLTGAGIYPAMTTGRYAAEVGVKAIHMGDLSESSLLPFEALWRHELGQSMKYSALVQRVVACAPVSVDFAMLGARFFPATVRKLISKV